jgi:hemerythrin superfamily protein
MKLPISGSADLDSRNGIDMLRADHEVIRNLFAEYSRLGRNDHEAEKAELVAEICRKLTVHAQLEEEIFYPAARDALDSAPLDEAAVEHAALNELLGQLRVMNLGDDLYDAKVTVLGEYVNHHVNEEENKIFPQVRSALDTNALGERILLRRADLEAKQPVESYAKRAPMGPGGDRKLEVKLGRENASSRPRSRPFASSH